jgi:hypothetical protein
MQRTRNYEASILWYALIFGRLLGCPEISNSGSPITRPSSMESRLSSNLVASIVSILSCDDRGTILRGKETGHWVSAVPSTVNATEVSKQEFRDALLLRSTWSPADLQSHCDGCGAKFGVRHGLECKKGGLVISRNNEIRDELSYLAPRLSSPLPFATNQKAPRRRSPPWTSKLPLLPVTSTRLKTQDSRL